MLDFKRAKFSRQDAGVTINKMPALLSTKCRRFYQQNAGDYINKMTEILSNSCKKRKKQPQYWRLSSLRYRFLNSKNEADCPTGHALFCVF
jgi:hypothetical protein